MSPFLVVVGGTTNLAIDFCAVLWYNKEKGVLYV